MSKHPRTDEYRAAFDLPRDEMACFAETLEAELAAARRLAAQWQTEALESRKAIETLTKELAAVWRAMRRMCIHYGGTFCRYHYGKCAERWQDCPAMKEAK